ncbi:c-type cytochrome [Roseibium aggregatum]|uniref:C-type cytochrome n=1 Tax=Roseibium aggregatum TaxID=187304 RepID=A0A926P6A4_9HYPH|nr:c-type cytochrome [Roseibium aggregatum]MBD1549206.1 c-type cytochrome [Roseibium aggregatum]
MKRAIGIAAVVLAGTITGASAEELLARGEYLVNNVAACGNCHTPQTPNGPDTSLTMAGSFVGGEEGVFKAFAPNITPDKKTGIGNWTDAEISLAIREGKRPDGTIIGPPMPISLYRGLSDTDLKAMVVYLRTVTPVENEVPKSTYYIPLPPAYGPPVGEVADMPRDDKVAYGAYLAGPVAHCMECHTTFVKGRPDMENRLGAGGNSFKGPWGVSVSANITPHEDGIAKYSDKELAMIIRHGVRPDGTHLMPPMGFFYYAGMSDGDVGAIIAYLRQLKPLASK